MGRSRQGAVLDGGPMDGHRMRVDRHQTELDVTMLDGSRHRYVRVTSGEDLFRWHGRI
jgi:hypothetical protein